MDLLHIDRPSGHDISSERAVLQVRDENALLAAEVRILVTDGVIQVKIERSPSETISSAPRVEVIA